MNTNVRNPKKKTHFNVMDDNIFRGRGRLNN